MSFKVKQLLLFFFVLHGSMTARPLVKTIMNNSPFIFSLTSHNDTTDCSPLHGGKTITIMPFESYHIPLLLMNTKPSLILHPIGYQNRKSKQTYRFIDKDGTLNQEELDAAFYDWKKENRRSFKSSQDWLKNWVGGDVMLMHNDTEFYGYLLNASLAKIENENYVDHSLLSFSEGLFSRLMIQIEIEVHRKKGVQPKVTAYVGQGGICKNGSVVEL